MKKQSEVNVNIIMIRFVLYIRIMMCMCVGTVIGFTYKYCDILEGL